MNKSRIESIRIKLEDFTKDLSIFLTEIKAVEAREKHVERKLEIVRQKETGILNREAQVNKDKSDAGVKLELVSKKISELGEKNKIMLLKEQKLEERKAEIGVKEDGLTESISKLGYLEEKKAQIDEIENDLKDRGKKLNQREALIEKQKKIDRDRKEMLDARENKIKLQQAKLQRFLDIS